MFRLTLLFFTILCTFQLTAQSSLAEKIQKRHDAQLFKTDQNLRTHQFINDHFEQFGLSSAEDLVFDKEFSSANNWTRLRYKQQYQGLEVLGSSYILHQQNGLVKKSSGYLFPDINLDVNPVFDVDQINAEIKNQIITQNKDEHVNLASLYHEIKISDVRLAVMDKAYPSFSGGYVLVYELVAEYTKPHHHKARYVVDASTGLILDEFEMICEVHVEGTAKTRYYGEQTIGVDSISPNLFRTHDEVRNVSTVNANQFDFNGVNNYAFFEDEDNYWDNANADEDDVAGDAHYCSAAYHDFMDEKFGWDGVDGEGGELIAVIHVNGKYYVNAYWDGTATYYGNGDCINYDPLTTLDVVGHEFAHGFTEFTSGLIYRNESGALNESISDIVGKSLENAYDPDNFTWDIGRRFITGEVDPFRSMEDPIKFGSPKFYQGELWVTGFFDNGGVHFNSGVYNYWYYLLVNGGAGTNEVGNSFDVASIGWEKALDIVYGSQVGYFGPSTNYVDAFNFTLEYTADLYGTESPEYAAVAEAWYAVGLSNDIPQTAIGGALTLTDEQTTLCPGDSTEVFVYVINTGLDTVYTGTTLYLRYTLDNNTAGDEQLVLDMDFAPGDTIPFTFQEKIPYVSNDGQKYLQILLSIDNPDNFEQIAYDFINYTSGDGTDLELSRVELTPIGCDGDTYTLVYYFSMESCAVLPEGERIDLVFTFPNGTRTVVREGSAIRPSVTYINIQTVNFDFPLDELNDYTVEMVHPDDENTSNNSLDQSLKTFETMMNNDIETFEDYTDQTSQFLYVDDGFISFHQLTNETDQKLIIGADNTFINATPCPDPEDVYDNVFFYGSLINTCFSTLDMVEPVLRFELTPYYSQMVEGFTEDFTSMVKVAYFDDFGSFMEFPIIAALPEGEEEAIEFDLPISTGEIDIRALCMLGDQNEVNQGNFNNGDYLIFNNIRIEEKIPSSVQDQLRNDDFLAYPNPASDVVNFSSKDGAEFDISVFTLDGKTVFQKANLLAKYNWQVPESMQGLYIYQANYTDGTSAIGKLVIE